MSGNVSGLAFRNAVRSILHLLPSQTPLAPVKPDAALPVHYRAEHALFVDGVEKTKLPAFLDPAAVVLLVNLQPYSSLYQPGLSVLAPHGLYAQIARFAQGKWGDQADIEFAYDILPESGPAPFQSGVAADGLYPTISIKALA